MGSCLNLDRVMGSMNVNTNLRRRVRMRGVLESEACDRRSG